MSQDEVEARARALVAEHTGGRVEAVVSAEDVFGGFFVLLADRGVFVKELFGDLEIRDEYPWDDVDAGAVEIIDGFGGPQVRAPVGERVLHLKRLTPDAADLIARRLRGEPFRGGDAIPSGTSPDHIQSGAVEVGSEAGHAADWTPIGSWSPPSARSEPVQVPSAGPSAPDALIGAPPETAVPTPPRSGVGLSGCLLTILVLALAGIGTWQLVALHDAYATLDARVEREATLVAELERTRSELAELRERVAALDGGDADAEPAAAPAAEPALENLPSAAEAPGWPEVETLYPVELGDSPSRGPTVAWVTLVEVSDFECPHCARVQPILEELRRSYGKDLRTVFKHYPLPDHEHALAAARAAECAREQGKFWRLHDWFYAHQAELGRAPMEDLVREAGGLNYPRWLKCWEAEKHLDRIDADRDQARRFNVGGVPAFFINGRLVENVASLADLERVVDQELARARQSGVPRPQFYRKFVLSE